MRTVLLVVFMGLMYNTTQEAGGFEVIKYVTLSRVFSLVELLLCGAAAVACVAYKSAFKGFSIF